MSEQAKTCPDCRCALHQVKLLDTYGPGTLFAEPRYTTPDAAPKLFRGMPISGTVKGWICPQCNRILLYGEPEQSP